MSIAKLRQKNTAGNEKQPTRETYGKSGDKLGRHGENQTRETGALIIGRKTTRAHQSKWCARVGVD